MNFLWNCKSRPGAWEILAYFHYYTVRRIESPFTTLYDNATPNRSLLWILSLFYIAQNLYLFHIATYVVISRNFVRTSISSLAHLSFPMFLTTYHVRNSRLELSRFSDRVVTLVLRRYMRTTQAYKQALSTHTLVAWVRNEAFILALWDKKKGINVGPQVLPCYTANCTLQAPWWRNCWVHTGM